MLGTQVLLLRWRPPQLAASSFRGDGAHSSSPIAGQTFLPPRQLFCLVSRARFWHSLPYLFQSVDTRPPKPCIFWSACNVHRSLCPWLNACSACLRPFPLGSAYIVHCGSSLRRSRQVF
jgi:hypothetical protein